MNRKTIFIMWILNFMLQLSLPGARWPISNSSAQNADCITSPFGPRNNRGTYQIHYGLDIRSAEGTVFSAVQGGTVVDRGNLGSRGNFLEVEHADGSVMHYYHLKSIPTLAIGAAVSEGQALGQSGSSGTQYAHLHLGYYPEGNGAEREDTHNPLLILPHQEWPEYGIEDLTYIVDPNGNDRLSFRLLVNPKRLDWNSIDLYIGDTYNIHGFLQLTPDILGQEEGFLRPPNHGGNSFYQTSGLIDLWGRSGYDYGERIGGANMSEWNNVIIAPAEFQDSDQSGDHRYTISFRLKDSKLRTLVGGLGEVAIAVTSALDDFEYSVLETSWPVSWTEEWPYNIWNTYLNPIIVDNNGRLIITNANSSIEQHPGVSFEDITIRNGGLFELEAGPDPDHRTYFTLESSIIVESGGAFRLGNYSRFLNHGVIEILSGAGCESGTDAEIVNHGLVIDNCGLKLDKPGACIIVKNDGMLKIGYATTFTIKNKGVLIVDSGEVVMEDRAKIEYKSDAQLFNIRPGSSFKLGDNAQIIIDGKIEAVGTAAEKIYFGSTYDNPGVAQYWQGIMFNNSADDNSIIKHALIEHAVWGIFVRNASPTIENNVIRNCNLYHLRFDYSTARVRNNQLDHANLTAGIYLRYSDLRLENNVVQNNSKDGIYLYRSNPIMIGNIISANTRFGIYSYNYSSPNLATDFSRARGNNSIIGNDDGIFAHYYSNPFLGSGPYSRDGGYNRIMQNRLKAVRAASYCDVSANYNWWGQFPPSSTLFETDGTSSINYDYALAFDPDLAYLKSSANAMIIGTTPPAENSQYFPGAPGPRQLLELARYYRFQNAPLQAVPIYKKLLAKYPHRVEARWGLIELVASFREAHMDSSVAYLQILRSHLNSDLASVAADLLTGEFLRKGNIPAAIANARETLANHPGPESEKAALFDLFNIHFLDLNDGGRALHYLSQLQAKFPAAEVTFHAQALWSQASAFPMSFPAANRSRKSRKNTVPAPPQTFELFQNYPNPFNPATTIRFALPEARRVKLTVYAVTGQKIKTLMEGYLEAGYHALEWDGRNEAGSLTTSGVYLYQLQAGRQQRVRKMILLK